MLTDAQAEHIRHEHSASHCRSNHRFFQPASTRAASVTATEAISLITGILTIVGVIVGLTRFITQLQLKVSQEQLEAEKKLAEKRADDFEARNRELINQIALVKRVGTAALNIKMEIDDALVSVMTAMQAEAGSIFIPLSSRYTRASSDLSGLVFLSIQPPGKQATSLKKKIIPMQSSAGKCFLTGKAYVSPNSKADPQHYGKADLVSGYRTEDILNFPLRYRGDIVGVLQLLNKEGSDHFSDSDIPLVEAFVDHISEKVSDFIRIPDNYDILGITPERESESMTVMFCDLTRSSILFQEMSVSGAIQHINEYLETLSDIAIRHGATVDKYIGDGVLFKFNVPRPIKQHPLQAATAALEMQAAFERLKSDWITMGEPLHGLFSRIGIAYGEVNQAVIGHPQYQYLTVYGQPVNVAVNLCEAAVRDRNVIVIDQRMHAELGNRIIVEQLPKERLGKASSYLTSAYELRSLAA